MAPLYLPPARTLALVTALFAAALFVGGCNDSGTSQTGEAADDHGDVAVQVAAHTHNNPDETCFICDASLRDKGRLWCKEHGRYEDRCWLCHPEIEEKDRLYCKEHFLYEDECFLCHPELKDDADTSATEPAAHAAPPGGGLFCNEHGVDEIECGICQPDLAAALKPGGSMKIRMPSTASAGKVGIQSARPRVSETAPGISAFCEVQFNLNTMAKVTPFAPGVIREVKHDVGDDVSEGDALITLHSAEIAAAKSAYLTAVVQREIAQQDFERQTKLKERQIVAEKDYLQAQASLRVAEFTARSLRQKLINLGFADGEIGAIEQQQDTSPNLVVRAPFSGTLVSRNAVVGEAVEVGHPLFTIADLSSRWLVLSVPTRYIGSIESGLVVDASFDELPREKVTGRITWVDNSVDPRTKMVTARALVTTGIDRIKTGLFGNATIYTSSARPATIVPRAAVQQYEGGDYVFIQDEADLFSLRRVALGTSTGSQVEILSGLQSTEPVVTAGSFIVMSEFLKSRLGAGCTDH